MTDTLSPLQFTRSRNTPRRGLYLAAGLIVFAGLVLLWCFTPTLSGPSWLVLGVMPGLRLGMLVGAIFLISQGVSDFEETWTFAPEGIALTSRTLWGRTERTWPLQKADIRLQPEGTPLAYNLMVRIGKGEWMMVFSFDDKHLAAHTIMRIESLIASA